MLKAKSAWWVMSKEYRQSMFQQNLFPLLASYSEYIQFQVYNAEAFHAKVSDFVTIETQNLEKYYQFLQKLKATKLFAGEYFELDDIIMGAENGFRDFNESARKEQAILLN